MGSLQLIRPFGIDVKVHVSFLLALGLGAFQWSHYGASGAAFGAVLVALLFVCVVLHELGHALVAKGFGIPVRQIILLPIGGVAQLTRKPKTPGQELAIALAGPLVNVVLAAGLLGLGWLVLEPGEAEAALAGLNAAPPSLMTLWVTLTASNLLLAVFNMLPALPMDGGRVLRALLALGLGQTRATQIAAIVSRVLSVAMLLFALFTGQLVLALIAVFVFFGAGAELREERLAGALERLTVGEALNPRAVTFTPDTTLSAAIQWLIRDPQPAFAVVLGSRLVGVVERRALVRAARELGPLAYVAEVMERAVPRVWPSDTLSEARQQMKSSGRGYVAVMGEEVRAGEDGPCLWLLTEQELAQQAQMAEIFSRFRGQPRSTFVRE